MTDKETFRHVIGHFASGVTVLTSRDKDDDFGATASAVSSLSLEPPMLLVCLNTRGSTQQAIHASRAFGVNILDEDQGIVAERFASPHGPKFEGLNVERGEDGMPLLPTRWRTANAGWQRTSWQVPTACSSRTSPARWRGRDRR